MFALCEDAKGAPWMAVSILWDHASLKRHGFKKFVDRKFDGEMDRDFELVEDAVVRYMSVSRIKGYCYTVACSRGDFAKRKANAELPTHSREGMVKFCRVVYDSRLREIHGPRVLDSDAKLEDVGWTTEVIVHEPDKADVMEMAGFSKKAAEKAHAAAAEAEEWAAEDAANAPPAAKGAPRARAER